FCIATIHTTLRQQPLIISNFREMSSTGASFAHVYVQQKRQREKMKRMEEERGRSGNDGAGGAEEKNVGNGKGGKSKKIHPDGGSVSSDSARRFAEAKDSMA
ncbi:unnamed protein product, partial [Ilex paraguariensis]